MSLPSMWDQLDGTTHIEGHMRRTGQLAKDISRWEKEGDRLMLRIVENRTDAERSRIDTAPRIKKPTEAYMDAWVAGDEKERLELVALEEAPIPPVTEDNGPHGGQGKGLKLKDPQGRARCGRCGKLYDGVTSHGPSFCDRAITEENQ